MNYVAWFGAVVGSGGLILGVYNAIRARGSERRKRQGDLRDELRVLVTSVRDELTQWKFTIKIGNSGYMARGLTGRPELGRMRELAPRIVKPASSDIIALPEKIEEITQASARLRKAWQSISQDQRVGREQREHVRETHPEVSKEEASARLALDESIALCHELIRSLDKLDRGWRY